MSVPLPSPWGRLFFTLFVLPLTVVLSSLHFPFSRSIDTLRKSSLLYSLPLSHLLPSPRLFEPSPLPPQPSNDKYTDRVLYPRTFIYAPPPLPHVASLLRASHLLRVPSFEAYARKAVEDVWSAELDSIRASGSLGNDDLGSNNKNKNRNASEDIRTHGLSATEAVVLGRTCGLEGVVKRGMYELVKSETFEQGDDDGDNDEEEEEEGSDSSMGGVGRSRAKGKGKGVMRDRQKRKEGEKGRKREKLTQKDYMKLTTARARLLSRWMRETAQFPTDLLPCATSTARAGVNHGPEGSGGTGREAGCEKARGLGGGTAERRTDGDGEWEGCTGSDPLAAREAHRRLVLQSGVQEAYMNDVVGGLGVLFTLNWGRDPRGRGKAGGVRRNGRELQGQGGRKMESGNAGEEGQGEEGEVYYGGFCEDCVGRLEKVWGGARERVWKDFGVLFGAM